jgi:hypothetical protein
MPTAPQAQYKFRSIIYRANQSRAVSKDLEYMLILLRVRMEKKGSTPKKVKISSKPKDRLNHCRDYIMSEASKLSEDGFTQLNSILARSDENDTLTIVEDLMDQLADALRTERELQVRYNDLDTARWNLAKDLASQQSKLDNVKTEEEAERRRVIEDIAHSERKWAERLKQMTQKYQIQVQEIQRVHNLNIASWDADRRALEEKHETSLNSLQDVIDKGNVAILDDFEKEKDELAHIQLTELSSLRNENEVEKFKIRKEFEEDIARRKKIHEAQLNNLNKQHEQERYAIMTNSERDKGAMRALHEAEKGALREQYGREKDEIITSSQSQHRAMKKDLGLLSDALAAREGFTPIPDKDFNREFSDLAEMVNVVARVEWEVEQCDWTPEILDKLSDNAPRRLRRAIIQNTIWTVLFANIFCSPFRIFGEEGKKLESKWIKAYGEGTYSFPNSDSTLRKLIANRRQP